MVSRCTLLNQLIASVFVFYSSIGFVFHFFEKKGRGSDSVLFLCRLSEKFIHIKPGMGSSIVIKSIVSLARTVI